MQSLQDIAQVWMNTAGLVFCNIPLCRKHGAKTATQSLYCIDPDYVPPPGSGSGKNTILCSHLFSGDWGTDSSHQRDDDMRLGVRMTYALFRGEIVNAPNLFPANQASFTPADMSQCLGFSTMTDNAKNFFKGGWWQWRQKDDIRSLMGAVPAMYKGLDRCTDNEDYSPYGRPETRQEAAGDTAMPPADAVREGSADTQPDNMANVGPSLGEC